MNVEQILRQIRGEPENAVTMTSFAENEIYPMVLNRIQERVSGENK
ncbi:hypothetical protein NVP1084O_077 [Vibrio phage 1.084.O._10N.261.49.F5]|nr:hypothetical protein NVP1084O_077 [Vibrio phage 1.084.O._10N.261.49.F5]